MSSRKFGFEMGDRFKRERDPATKRKGYFGIRLKGSPTLQTGSFGNSHQKPENEKPQFEPEIEKVTMGNHKSVSPVLEKYENSKNIEDMEKVSYGFPWLPFEKEAQIKGIENKDTSPSSPYAGMDQKQLTEILIAAGNKPDKIQDPIAWKIAWRAAWGLRGRGSDERPPS